MLKLTPEKLTAFCAALAETGIVGKACAAIGMTRQQVYVWRRDMPDFADEWDAALKIGVTALEDEAHRRAFIGVDEPLVHKGQFTYLYEEVKGPDGQALIDETTLTPVMRQRRDKDGNPMVATVSKASDLLTIFLLKAHCPEKYRDNSRVELAGSVEITKATDSELDDELAQLELLERTRTAALTAGAAAPDTFDDLV
jgi:hypothetical protein